MGGFYMTPDYGYEPYAQMPSAASDVFGIAGVFLAFFGVIYLALAVLAIASYVLQSVGLYSIAKRRGINNPWLAWIPIGNLWILGSISDQYQYVVKGRVRNRRKTLLGLEIAAYLVLVPMIISLISAIVGIAMDSVGGVGIGALVLVLSYLALIVLSILMVVFYYIALYDLYMSCDSGNATLYLVLSILFGITLPFFIFFNRKKDAGMPPRKAEPQAAPKPVFPVTEEVPAEPACEEASAEAVCEEPPVEETAVEETPAAETPEETE